MSSERMAPWVPDSNPHQHRRLGKTGEELAELLAVISRISIQGIDEIDPSSGKTNRERLTEELADVDAQVRLCRHFFGLDACVSYVDRVHAKMAQMLDWESHFNDETVAPITAQHRV